MAAKNGYAALVRQRSSGDTKRRRLDDYETPEDKTVYLTDAVKFHGPILEPACGSGRMVRALRDELGVSVVGYDIKLVKSHDFFKRVKRWRGDIVTNPPYRDGLAERFTRHALKLADGRVAMLMQSGFLWGDKRATGLYADCPPEKVIVIPERIYFFAAGKPITSQFFNHAWLVWPERKKRERGGYDCPIVWAQSNGGF